MSDEDRYTTITIPRGLRDELREMKGDGDTYADVIHRALGSLSANQDRQKSRFTRLAENQQQQARLLVRMADEIGLEKEYIPRDLAALESVGVNHDTDALQRAQEETVDVFGERDSEDSEDSEAFDWDDIPDPGDMPSASADDAMSNRELAIKLDEVETDKERTDAEKKALADEEEEQAEAEIEQGGLLSADNDDNGDDN